jgi:hypothetical protein
MNPAQQNSWQDAILTEILRAISNHELLKQALVFKGARILSLHLGSGRKSLDIDANLQMEFQAQKPDREQQAAWFETQLTTALHNHFEAQEPVRYELISVKIEKRPAQEKHPRGWDGFVAKFKIADQRLRDTKGLPTIELDLAAPETLGPDAVCELLLDGISIQAYSLHRIAGEKLRAFLESLPAYRTKMGRNHRTVRAKDLHDLALILAAKPITDTSFWLNAAHEFQLASESRLVDCSGPETFYENWELTQAAYKTDLTLSAVSWMEAEEAIGEVLEFFWPGRALSDEFLIG